MRCFEDSVDHLIEFSDKSCRGQRAALMVPARSRVGFFDGGRMKGEWGSAHSRADKSRRRASSSETGLTAPESMSAMRRATSSSQAASTDSSCVSSRLSMREPARSARSDTGRESAFFKSSAASLVMASFYPQRARCRQEPNNPCSEKKLDRQALVAPGFSPASPWICKTLTGDSVNCTVQLPELETLCPCLKRQKTTAS